MANIFQQFGYQDHNYTCQGAKHTYSLSCSYRYLTVEEQDGDGNVLETIQFKRHSVEVIGEAAAGSITLIGLDANSIQNAGGSYNDAQYRRFSMFFAAGTPSFYEGKYHQERPTLDCPTPAEVGSAEYDAALLQVNACLDSCCGDFNSTTSPLTPILAGIDTSIPASHIILGTNSVGNFIRFKHDSGNNGSYDYVSSWVTNDAAAWAHLTGQTFVDGDLVAVEVAVDNQGSGAVEVTGVIPESTIAIDTYTNISTVLVDISGIFDPNTSQRNFSIQVYDASNNLLGSLPAINGQDVFIDGLPLDLSSFLNEGDSFTLRLTASDEQLQEITPSEVNFNPAPAVALVMDNCTVTFPSTAGAFFRLGIDSDNDGTNDLSSGWGDHPTVETFAQANPAYGGSRVTLDVANLPDYSDAATKTLIVPKLTQFVVGVNMLDYSDVEFIVGADFDPTSTQRNYQIVVVDGADQIVWTQDYVFASQGATDSRTITADLSTPLAGETQFKALALPYDENGTVSVNTYNCAVDISTFDQATVYNVLIQTWQPGAGNSPTSGNSQITYFPPNTTNAPFIAIEADGVSTGIVPINNVSNVNIPLYMENGETIEMRGYRDSQGINLVDEDRRSIPEPGIVQPPLGGGNPLFTMSNASPDTIANTYNAGNYDAANDLYELRLTFNRATFETSGNTLYQNFTVTLTGLGNDSINTNLQAALEAAGLSPVDAADVVGQDYFTGTFQTFLLEMSSMYQRYGLSDVNVALDITHNYTDGGSLRSAQPATAYWSYAVARVSGYTNVGADVQIPAANEPIMAGEWVRQGIIGQASQALQQHPPVGLTFTLAGYNAINGDTLFSQVFANSSGSPSVLLDQDRKRIPTPSVNCPADTDPSPVRLPTTNTTQDNVANTYIGGNYFSSNDEFEHTITFNNLRFTTGSPAVEIDFGSFTFTIRGNGSSNITSADVEAALLTAGMAASHANEFAGQGWLDGTYNNPRVDKTQFFAYFNSTSSNWSTHVYHNYTDGTRLRSATPALCTVNHSGVAYHGGFTGLGPNITVAIPDSLNLGPFVEAGVISGPSSGVVANPPSSNILTFGHTPVNGEIQYVRLWTDAVRTQLVAESRKQVPTPSIAHTPTAAGVPTTFSINNLTQDSVANIYKVGDYDPADDRYDVTIQVIGDIVINGNTYTDVSAVFSNVVGDPLEDVADEFEFQGGMLLADATVLASYISGNIDSIVIDFPNGGSTIGLKTVDITAQISHQYGPIRSYRMLSQPVTLAYDHCAGLIVPNPNEDCTTFAQVTSVDAGGGNTTVTIQK